MMKWWKHLWRDRRGNALAIAGAALPLLVGAAGLATDTIEWTLWKRELQRAADSAAIAGVYERVDGASDAETTAAVSHDLTINQHTGMSLVSGYPQVSFPTDSGQMRDQVRVTLAVRKELPFSSLFMSEAPTIIANATAATVPGPGTACIQALETSASATGITNSGNTNIEAPACVLHSNSPSTNSASAGGSSSVTALAVSAVGGIQESNNWSVESYQPYSPALPDPFESVTPDPDDMNCTTSALSHTTNFSSLPSGTNCFSSLSVGSNKTVNVPDNFGPIYINGGDVDLKGAFNCTGCTIVLTNKDTSDTAAIGTVKSNAQASNNITAPTSGAYKGIAIYQDRRAQAGTPKINGGSSSTITGALYFPSQELWFNGGGSVTASCTMMVARRIVFTGNSGIKLKGLDDCGAEGLPSSNSVRMIRLVA